MDTRHHQDLVLLRDIPYKLDDFVASRRVQSTSRFVQEEDSRGGDELAGDAVATLLAAGYAFANWCAD
jgi:hypothetical protein